MWRQDHRCLCVCFICDAIRLALGRTHDVESSVKTNTYTANCHVFVIYLKWSKVISFIVFDKIDLICYYTSVKPSKLSST